MGAYYEHLSYADRLSIDEGRRAGLSLSENYATFLYHTLFQQPP